MTYPLEIAVDTLDELARGATPPREELVRAAIALALYAKASKEQPSVLEMLQALENVALEKLAAFSEEQRQQAAELASTLRRRVGVH